jgi:hypothetical protein
MVCPDTLRFIRIAYTCPYVLPVYFKPSTSTGVGFSTYVIKSFFVSFYCPTNHNHHHQSFPFFYQYQSFFTSLPCLVSHYHYHYSLFTLLTLHPSCLASASFSLLLCLPRFFVRKLSLCLCLAELLVTLYL